MRRKRPAVPGRAESPRRLRCSSSDVPGLGDQRQRPRSDRLGPAARPGPAGRHRIAVGGLRAGGHVPEQPDVDVLGQVLEVAALLAAERPVGQHREAQRRPAGDHAEVEEQPSASSRRRLGRRRRAGGGRARAGRAGGPAVVGAPRPRRASGAGRPGSTARCDRPRRAAAGPARLGRAGPSRRCRRVDVAVRRRRPRRAGPARAPPRR